LQKRIASTKFGIHTNLVASKMPANKDYKNTFIKTAERLKKYLKELETHARELKKHI
jgi:hypothetical protein